MWLWKACLSLFGTVLTTTDGSVVLARDFFTIQAAFAKPETHMFLAPTWSSLKTKIVTAVGFPSIINEVYVLMW